jgi:hypothetical protein
VCLVLVVGMRWGPLVAFPSPREVVRLQIVCTSYGDFGRDGAEPSKCGQGDEGGRFVASDGMTDTGGGDVKGD